MKRSIMPFVVVAGLVSIWFGILISVYQEGERKEAIIYAKIPTETINFLNKLLDSIDQYVKYDPMPDKKDWDNHNDEGENDRRLERLEDEYFIVYFAKNNEGEKGKAEKVLGWAHEAILPLEDLMGKYYYPLDVKGRKLPIYLADSQANYTRIIGRLKNDPNIKEQTGSWGMYLCSYSTYGCLTKGIVIHPDPWRQDLSAKQTLWHEMNHYVFYTSLNYGKPITPYLWASEGIAEYFAKGVQHVRMGREQINRLRNEHLNKRFDHFIDNYVGGHSVYTVMVTQYGEDKLNAFLQICYKEPMSGAYPSALRISERQFESVWKSYLERLP